MREQVAAAGRRGLAVVLRWLPAAGPTLFFVVLYAATYGRWVMPFQDCGREVGVASRFFLGGAIYRDIAYWFGSVPPTLDAMAFLVLGHRLEALFALRAILALAGVEALRRLVLRLVPSPGFAAAATCLVVSVCVFEPGGGAWAFPYTVAALEGIVLSLVALEAALGSTGPRRSLFAAAVAALACGTKLEMIPMALGGVGVALLWRRPRREALVSVFLAAAAGSLFWLVPLARYDTDLLGRRGFLMAFHMSEELKGLYRFVLLGSLTREQLLSWEGLRLYLPSAALFAAALFLSRSLGNQLATPLLFASGIAASLMPSNLAVQVLVPLASAAFVVEGVRAIVRKSWRDPGANAAVMATGAAMVPFLARQPLFLMRYCPYSAFSGPLALTISLTTLARWTGGTKPLGALVLGLALGHGAGVVRDFHDTPREWVRSPRGSLLLPAAEARLIDGLVTRLSRDTKPGDYVAGFPEPGVVLFLAERRTPFAFEHFNPGEQGAKDEKEMITALDRTRPGAAFIVNRSFPEYGRPYFGRGYLDDFMRVFGRQMERVETLERPPGGRPRALRADAAIYFRPRPPS